MKHNLYLNSLMHYFEYQMNIILQHVIKEDIQVGYNYLLPYLYRKKYDLDNNDSVYGCWWICQ